MSAARTSDAARLRLEIRGAVQGVGFRPFVFRVAGELGLAGWIVNDTRGVFIEAEGGREALERFRSRVGSEHPPHAVIESLEAFWLPPAGFDGFEIRASDGTGSKTALILPDLATCSDCLAEVMDPGERRHAYPFANCTMCGPRFTIVRALPYDRPNTTMAGFPLCAACRREYGDPGDRRFHAQPIACAACGPGLALWASSGTPLAAGDDALRRAAESLAAGEVVAVKGLGGFHLIVDAADQAAVVRLRERKQRHGKPLALMVRDLEQARALCVVSPAEEAELTSAAAPILLLPRRPGARVADAVAPANPYLGLMLPATPLHHLLMRAVNRPVVATSGNLSEEPICTDEREAVDRLGGIADRFLVHDRPIERHVDDSVAALVRGRVRLLRRARGHAPLPVPVGRALPAILAVGAHLKNTVALSVGRQVIVSQHIGDLETPQAQAAFERVIADFLRLYETEPVLVAHDLHPDYGSTQWARTRYADRAVAVQHHHAHLAACLAEHRLEGGALGVVWDGTGYGTDGTVWGGEFLLGDASGFTRVAHLRPFRLPGGEAAVREPRRTAFALLREAVGDAAHAAEDLDVVRGFTDRERALLARMLDRGVNAPVTTSAGRLFDGAAALCGMHPRVTFEGEAAMALEWAVAPGAHGAYTIEIARDGDVPTLDWRPMVCELVADVRHGAPLGRIAARFHDGLVQAAVRIAETVGAPRVALTGGCFQNRILTERLADALGRAGHEVLLHERVPPNDGGVSLGQVMVAAATHGRT